MMNGEATDDIKRALLIRTIFVEMLVNQSTGIDVMMEE